MGPSYGLAKDTIWNDPRMLPHYVPDWYNPSSQIVKKRETELRVDFLKSHGQIYVYGADRPDLMRGPNPMGVVLDEFSVMKPEVWTDIVQPVMRSNPKAWCWFLFTPRGKNHAYKIFQYGNSGEERYSKEWKSWKLNVLQSGIFTPEQVENAQSTMSEGTFNQELMCEFLEGEGAVFRSTRAVATAKPHGPIEGHRYTMGVDLAKLRDYTVIAVYDRQTNDQVYQDRFQSLEWPFQKKKIKGICDYYNHANVMMDATGLGDPIVDDLLRVGVPVEPIKLTINSKKDIIEKLSIWIEQKKIKMLPMEETMLEFDNYSFEIGPTGMTRYGAPEGFHDDIVIAHALAVWSLVPVFRVETFKEPTLIQNALAKARDIYNRTEEEENEEEWDIWARDN